MSCASGSASMRVASVCSIATTRVRSFNAFSPGALDVDDVTHTHRLANRLAGTPGAR